MRQLTRKHAAFVQSLQSVFERSSLPSREKAMIMLAVSRIYGHRYGYDFAFEDMIGGNFSFIDGNLEYYGNPLDLPSE